MSKKTPAQQAADLMGTFLQSKEVHDVFTEKFSGNYEIRGKTLTEWEQYFRITVPPDPDPAVCKMLDMEIMGLHQEASLYHALAEAHMQALKKGSETQYRSRYTAIIAEYKANNPSGRLPGVETLSAQAKFEIDDIEGALTNAELQMNFFKNMMNHLNMCRRMLEQAMWNNNIQYKMDNNHGGNIYDQRN
jgi:hypothetical protein